ncbi:MAG TPA: NAD(P)H-dependent oxidoreductase [Stellaceae bacterium]|nr:NAD(P)H-dependent oxidoreductase [Stellaceae bacterium]
MTKRIAIIQGHPDAARGHLCHALAEAYASGAKAGGHEVVLINVAEIDFPILRTKEAFETGAVPPALAPSQEAIGRADHLLIVYPLWLGTMPALLKAFLEQVFRPGFAFMIKESGKLWKRPLKGKSTRIVVTMGMPVFFYRWYFGAHGLKSLERSILGFAGIGPIRESLFGMIEQASDAKLRAWLATLRRLGADAR